MNLTAPTPSPLALARAADIDATMPASGLRSVPSRVEEISARSGPSDLAVMRDEILGGSPLLAEVLRQVDTVARTGATVLIHGETGTGKELVARAIHRRSSRAQGAFVKVNCAAIPLGLLESELFGHEKGAFTGALARRTGRFELAQDGTLFLDEIGEMATELQPKLLRLLQEREFERLGSSRTIQSNARLVAATHRDLGAMVETRTFREDLFYRLSVFPIHLPPLRDRRGDIALLANSFVRRFARGLNKDVRGISSDAMARLERHDWPGNVRELQNVLERAVILTPSGEVGDAVIVERLRERSAPPPAWAPVAPVTPRADVLEEVERAHILSVLQKTNWVIAGPYGAAIRLGMKRSTLNFRMKKLGIVRNAEAQRAG